jgi:superfamily II DNA/RNA helicase
VHDRSWRALDALVGALDQLLTALDEHLDGDVVGDQVLLDQLTHEVEVGLAGRREADLDLLEAHRHQFFEHAQLAGGVHRVDERLVAVAQVDRAPQRRLVDGHVGPRAVGEDDGHERAVLLEGHRCRCDVALVARSPGTLAINMTESTARRGAPRRRRSRPQTSDQPYDGGHVNTSNLTSFNVLPPVEAPTGFFALGVPERIDDGLAACGFAQPFAIQTEAIPVAVTGKDVCGRAKTGSGKTLAFGVPMLARITDKAEPSRPLGLVLVPTRELAVQVAEVLEPVAHHAGMRVLPVYGGASRHHQVDELAKGVEIVIATPLRLIDLIKSNEVSLDDMQIVTLDEADRMADDGFTPQVEWILRHCGSRNQTMLFSATLDGDVGHLIRHYQTDPVTVAIDEATDTVGTMHHLFLAVHHMDKDKVIGSISKSIPKVLVFCQTKRNCDRVARNLEELGIDAGPLHGDMQQSARERILRKFAEGKLSVLVATDVAARGIDIDDIGAVIHYEPAKDVKDYLHRSGRTARAGRDGWAVTLVEYNQLTQMRILQRGMRLPTEKPIEVFSNDPRLLHLPEFELD